tara:strand:+ start:9373 stop:10290 length:918 start_codon:yes stop_codon:yes gene_type:complete
MFNRPDLAEQVFGCIREAAPPKLYLAVDGPRAGRENEAIAVAECRAIQESVDWPCEVYTLFSEVNQGCGAGVRAAIDWFFSCEEAGIILEDDCKPHPSFFRFCEEMLDRYKDDTRVFSVGGFCELDSECFANCSYQFSIYNLIWGWASWRRAWQCHNFKTKAMEEALQGDWLLSHVASGEAAAYWRKHISSALSGDVDTWDFQWRLAIWMNDGLSIVPSSNLIENIGFDTRSTHTAHPDKRYYGFGAIGIDFPLIHPETVERSRLLDETLDKQRFRIGVPVPRRSPLDFAKAVARRLYRTVFPQA